MPMKTNSTAAIVKKKGNKTTDSKGRTDNHWLTQPALPAWSSWRVAIAICSAAFLIRLLSLGLYPLQDTSEARYAEMARLMVATNDWITPWFKVGVPFWGKPPLFIWLSALSFKLFGLNEFAARLPILLVSLGVVGFSVRLALFQMERHAAALVLIILPTTLTFLVLSGTVMPDPVMLFSITMILCGFWIGWHSQDARQARRWQFLFFIGCALALLAKGLAPLVLAGLPIFIWCLKARRLITLWQRFPWIKGLLLTLLIAAPWYIAAELKTPGFLRYFIIGEHFDRYLESSWHGDKYGFAHNEPIGTIWVYWLLGALPWSCVLVNQGILWVKTCWRNKRITLSDWQHFLLLWFLCPLFFFSFARNIIWTYTLPTVPAMAFALAERGQHRWHHLPRWLTACSALIPLLVIGVMPYLMTSDQIKSQKILLNYVHQQSVSYSGILYLHGTPFSGHFYSRGSAKDLSGSEELTRLINAPNARYYLATENDDFDHLPDALRQRFTRVAHHRDWTLYLQK
ncbi:glycosyltransferase family 39 protein [Candidatus Sororendozoicomonas aggregata]|uniref:ArnT family glycosyltransferase n=1 Tax=Candidatus Sororendozoicomonas aggregata TaxID=3073239 RepID=UPI002ED37B9D